MRWYKHLTNSHNDERLAEVVHEFGLEGYGFWWLLLEIVGKEMDNSERCELSYPLATWARKLQCSKRKTSTFLQKFSEISLVFLEYDSENTIGKIRVRIPNLLKYRDEYSKKSGQTPDKKQKVSGAKIENTDTDTKLDKERTDTSSSSGDEDIACPSDFYMTKKKRKLGGKRLETFNLFWAAFDYKAGKAEAADAWLDIPCLTDTIVAQILAAAAKESVLRAEAVKKGYTPKMAQGWITGRRWEDEVGAALPSPPDSKALTEREETLAHYRSIGMDV